MYRCIKWKKNDRHIVQSCKTIRIQLYKGSPGDRNAKRFGIGARTKWLLLLVQLLSFQCRWCSKHSSYEHFVPTNAASCEHFVPTNAASCEHFVPTNAASYEHFVPTNASTLQAFHLFFYTTKMILSFCRNETKQNVNIILSHTVPPPAELTARMLLTYVKTSDRIAQKWIRVKWCITYTTMNLIWNVHILKVDYSSWKCWLDSSFANDISTHLPMRALKTQEVFVVQYPVITVPLLLLLPIPTVITSTTTVLPYHYHQHTKLLLSLLSIVIDVYEEMICKRQHQTIRLSQKGCQLIGPIALDLGPNEMNMLWHMTMCKWLRMCVWRCVTRVHVHVYCVRVYVTHVHRSPWTSGRSSTPWQLMHNWRALQIGIKTLNGYIHSNLHWWWFSSTKQAITNVQTYFTN